MEPLEAMKPQDPLIEFLETLKNECNLNCVGLVNRGEEIVMTGETAMLNSNEVQQACIKALNYAEDLNPVQVSGRVRTSPEQQITVLSS